MREIKYDIAEQMCDTSDEIVRLGLKCNEKCLFCNVPPDSGMPAGLALAVRVISSGVVKGKKRLISFSGGEPTLYPELGRLISYARQTGAKAGLQTNGIRLAERKAVENLVRAGLTHAVVSLHSHMPGIHDFLTGVPGSCVACVKAVRNLVSCGVETCLNPVITTANYKGLADYVRFVGRELGIKIISLSVVQPRGWAFKNHAIVPDYRLLDTPVRTALKTALKEGVTIINPPCGLPLCVCSWHKYPKQCVEYWSGKLGLPFRNIKTKAACCAKCAASAYCAGVWREYAQLRGFGALRPLTRRQFRA